MVYIAELGTFTKTTVLGIHEHRVRAEALLYDHGSTSPSDQWMRLVFS